MIIVKQFDFDAAHHLPRTPEGHKCHRLHGHTYRLDVEITASVADVLASAQGWIIDFADIAAAWAPVHDRLDHRCLNEVEGLENPTAEHLAAWIYRELRFALPLLSAVVLYESATTCCRFTHADAIGAPA